MNHTPFPLTLVRTYCRSFVHAQHNCRQQFNNGDMIGVCTETTFKCSLEFVPFFFFFIFLINTAVQHTMIPVKQQVCAGAKIYLKTIFFQFESNFGMKLVAFGVILLYSYTEFVAVYKAWGFVDHFNKAALPVKGSALNCHTDESITNYELSKWHFIWYFTYLMSSNCNFSFRSFRQ